MENKNKPADSAYNAFTMVVRLSVVAAALGVQFMNPAPIKAGACFDCEGGRCIDLGASGGGYEFCNQGTGNCVASCAC